MDDHILRRKRFLSSLTAVAASAIGLAAAGGGGDTDDGPLTTKHDDARTRNPVPEIPVVLQAFVEPIGSSEEGSVVELLDPAWSAVIGALAKDPEALFHLTPREFEELIAASYDAAGFDEVILTPRSGDFGRDVIAVKNGLFRIRIIDQAKAYAKGHRVSANDVRALSGVLHADPRATKGVVSTTSSFAPGIHSDPFLAPLIPYRLQLFDGDALRKRLLQPPE
jgi:restriction system protein